MGGLLYKDFVTTCRFKKGNLVWGMIIGTLLFAILRICLAGNTSNPDFLVMNDGGDIVDAVNILDVFFLMVEASFVLFGMQTMNSFIGKILEGDEKNKIKGYLSVMPLGKTDYIASKYIFLGIVAYVFLSIEMVCGVFCEGYCYDGVIKEAVQILNSSLVSIMCLSVFMSAIELPLFLTYGKEKAMYGKVVVTTGIALIIIGYVLFGDLSIFNNIDLYKIVQWAKDHDTELIVINVFAPILVSGLYYGSYKIACKLAARKEN